MIERPAEQSTILVVDDDARNRALVRGFLQSEHRVIEAADGVAALEILEREPVALGLLDVMMPGMSGFEVCQRIKAQKRETFLPVLLLTVLNDQDDRMSGLEAGAESDRSRKWVFARRRAAGEASGGVRTAVAPAGRGDARRRGDGRRVWRARGLEDGRSCPGAPRGTGCSACAPGLETRSDCRVGRQVIRVRRRRRADPWRATGREAQTEARGGRGSS